MRRSETRRLPVLAPLGAQGVADLAQRGLGPAGLEHGLDHVAVGTGHVDHVCDRGLDGGVVAVGTAFGEHTDLLDLDLVAVVDSVVRELDLG